MPVYSFSEDERMDPDDAASVVTAETVGRALANALAEALIDVLWFIEMRCGGVRAAQRRGGARAPGR
ncbi:hypothetical protein GCM10010503_40310 [Streptomyces lucensis JCM 4490]|uniref:Uncharacterized protein n=2 Tax=Streptomyces lucensis TaxID=67319 RepID=A0A918JBS6_9ACTN|nr:hypothetical protein GCM10010503_40310 [Streptomyces lucensis JCM 4490]